MSICLKYITIENYFDVLNLEVHPNQRNFIASNSIEPENHQARSCYLHYGFKETGEVIENEIVAIYDLTTKN